MSDNSDKRKKTLILSVLAFLFAGGGIFLFFIVQGSNDLTGKGKRNSFSYGTAAREGVSSFFKSMGVFPEEEQKLSEAAIARLEDRGLPLDGLGVTDPNPDMSDWLAKDGKGASASGSSSRPATPTSVPKMSHKAMGTTSGGGGGSKSAGSTTRFGGESASGTTSVTGKAQAGASGTTDKGTLGTLKNAKNLLGDGLRSNSAMTAQNKWGQSFGVGKSGKSGDLAYNKAGLVGLDKIKSGEIADLKMDKAGSLKTTDVSSPVKDEDGTKAALNNDKKVKEDAAAKMKADIAKQAMQAATDAAMKDDKPAGKDDKPGESSDPNKPPDEVMQAAMDSTCAQSCTTESGAQYTDASRTFSKNDDGSWNCVIQGTQTNPDGSVIAYSDTVTYDAQGNFLDLSVVEKPK
jgi:hypothetical protein